MQFGNRNDRYSDNMLALLTKLNLHSIGPGEMEQFAMDINSETKGNDVVVTTDESDVSAFLKLLIRSRRKSRGVLRAHSQRFWFWALTGRSMPDLNWEQFGSLPGSADRNFELLCRALIKTHFAQFGSFAALSMQPGVEFHLKLEKRCALGAAARWFGWQCRWYDLPKATAIGANRRIKIVKAIRATEKHLPGLTDWVLWTRYPLTKADQAWFNGLKTKMKLHQWSGLDVEDLLAGPGEIFRRTYFGDLVLTPATLKQTWETSVRSDTFPLDTGGPSGHPRRRRTHGNVGQQ